MKQTNNALKFLLAQYRAIFKNAALASMVAIATLATGAVTATTANASATAVTSEDLSGDKAITVDGTSNKLEISDSYTSWNAAVTITSGDTSTNYTKTENGAVKINESAAAGSLTISSTGDASVGFAVKAGSNNEASINLKDITINKGTLDITGASSKTATAIADTITVGGNELTAAAGDAKITLSGAENSGKATLGSENSAITIGKFGEISTTGDEAAEIKAKTFDIKEGGKLSLSKSGSVITDKLTLASGATIVSTADGASSIAGSGDNSTITLDAGSSLDLTAGGLSFTKGVITDKGATVSGTKILTIGDGSSNNATFKSTDISKVIATAGMLVKSGSSLELTAADNTFINVDKDHFQAVGTSDAGTAKKVTLASGSNLNVNNLSITADTNLTDTNKVNVTVSKALQLVKGASDNTMKTDLTLSAPKAQDGTAGTGTITAKDAGANFTLSNLTIAQGDWTNAAALTLPTSKNLKIGSGADASLTFLNGSSLTLDSGSITVGDGTNVGKLDLRQADVKTGANEVTVDVKKASTLTMTAEQYSGASAQLKTTVSGSLFLTGGDLTTTLEKSSASKGKIYVATGGTLAVEGTLTVNGLNSNALALGDATSKVKAQGLIISDAGTGSDSVKAVTLGTGDYTVTENIATEGGATQITVSGSTLTLGVNDEDVFNTGKLTTTTGTIGTNLAVGNNSSSGTLTVAAGSWSGRNLTIASGTATVNDGASLSATSLDVTKGSLTVSKGGAATFNSFKVVSGTVTVNGQLTVNGTDTSSNTSAPQAGTAGYMGVTAKEITVSGAAAKLTFTGSALKGLLDDTYDGTKVTDYVRDNYGKYTLAAGGTVELAYTDADQKSFTLAQTQQILKELVTGGDNPNSIKGVLSFGKADITGITGDGGIIKDDGAGNYSTSYSDYAKNQAALGATSNEILQQTKITGVNGDVYGHVGSLQLDASTQTASIASNTSLNKADSTGNFISNAQGQTAGAKVTVGDLTLNGSGKIGDVSLANNDNGLVLNGTELTVGKINGKGDVELAANAQASTGAIQVATVTTATGSALTVNGDFTANAPASAPDATTPTVSEIAGALTVNGNTSFTHQAKLGGAFATTGTASFKDDASFGSSVTVDKAATFEKKADFSGAVTLGDKATFTGATTFKDALTVTGVATFSDTATVGGNATFKETATFAKDATFAGQQNSFAKEVTFTQDANFTNGATTAGLVTASGDVTVIEGASLTADKIDFKTENTGLLLVGKDTGGENNSGSTGSLQLEQLNLNGGFFAIDPAYGQATSVAAIKQFGDPIQDSSGNTIEDAGTINGSIFVGQNAALGIGKNVSVQGVQAFINQFQENGSLNADEIGAILYVDEQVNVASGSKLIVDSTKGYSQVVDQTSKAFNTTYQNVIKDVDLYLGDNSVLAVSENAITENGNYAITFAADDAAIKAGENAKIILDGDSFLNGRTVKLFQDASGDGVRVIGTNDIRVESLNGLMYLTYEHGKNTTSKALELDTSKIDTSLLGASDPMRYTLFAYASKLANWEEYYDEQVDDTIAEADKAKPDYLVDAVDKTLASWDSSTGNGAIKLTTKAKNLGLTENDFVGVEQKDGSVLVYRKAHNTFLEQVVRNTDGSPAEVAARLGVFLKPTRY